ncbi:MAG TPA: DUF3800 domain-containing protein [Thermoanaerobaculia bacterium]|nr:DUF3800 domain-containing protein [Thermoanaerobaculia bacterium]
MKVLFLDESGDHSLAVIDPQYPLFILGGIILEVDYAKGEMAERLNAFKQDLLGREDLILHTADMVRNRNGFERLAYPDFRRYFYAELNKLLADLKFQIVACAIRKDAHLDRYGLAAVDPYHLGLEVLVERFCYEIGDRAGAGVIVAEKRDRFLDRQLRLAWLTLKSGGTRFVQAVQVTKRLKGLALRGKEENIAGLQVADLVVTPIGRSLLGKSSQIDYRMIQSKFRCNWKGGYDGIGLVVLPKD